MPAASMNPSTIRAYQAEVRVHEGRDLRAEIPRLAEYLLRGSGPVPLSRHPLWLAVLQDGLGHTPYALEFVRDERTCGVLPLALVRSILFGRFLVGLPYLNSGGVVADDDEAASALVDRAVALADRLDVRHLELRHEQTIEHPSLTHRLTHKVHMRLPLPETTGKLWDGLPSKVRNQVRKGQKLGLEVTWGVEDLMTEFYEVFSHNMRDLGTPTYGRRFFDAVLRHFGGPERRAELCVVRAGGEAAAAGLLVHGCGVSEILSASSLRRHNPTNANMLLYWNLLERSVARGQGSFDFGRSTRDGSHYRFKKQWGAIEESAVWQYHVRSGDPTDLRPESGKYRLMIQVWRRLPVGWTRVVGPPIVRGIP